MGEAAMIIDDMDTAEQLADVLKAVAHPLRLRAVAALCEAPKNVTELCERLGVRQALASQHLAVLRMSGLVSVDRTGGHSTYSIREPGLRNLIACLTGCKRG
jgi:DNA-binding transcriptional ArsR family regulator